MVYLLIFFTSLILTIFFTPYLIKFLKKNGVVDSPDERRVHKGIVPRMGGVIIFGIILVELLAFYSDLDSIRLVIMGAIFTALCGIIDDIDDLKWYAKFGVQFLVAGMLIVFLKDNFNDIELFGLIIPEPFNYLVLFFFIVGVINSINLLDGLDGLVSGYALLIFFIIISLAFVKGDELLIIISTAMMGSLLGFIKFNAYPARIFLGDTGSLTLGFFIVLVSLLTTLNFKPQTLDLTFPVILLAVPVTDTLKVMIMRILKGNNPFLADKTHFHHVIFGSPVKHKTTVFIIHSYTLFFTTLALYYLTTYSAYTFIAFALMVSSMLVIRRIMTFIKTVGSLKTYFETLLNFHYHILNAYNKSILWISAIAVVGVLITTFPVSVKLDKEIVSLIAFFAALMFLLASFNIKRTKDYNNIYVYLNMAFFFALYNIKNIGEYTSTFATLISSQNVLYGSFIVLSCIVLLFIIARERILPTTKIFLTGVDLTIIVLITLSFLLHNFFINEYLGVLAYSMVMSFIFYLWYRVIAALKERFSKPIFYSSFALPMLAVFNLIITG